MTDQVLAPHELLALRVAFKLDNGATYASLTERERMIANFMLTPGGCHACSPAARHYDHADM